MQIAAKERQREQRMPWFASAAQRSRINPTAWAWPTDYLRPMSASVLTIFAGLAVLVFSVVSATSHRPCVGRPVCVGIAHSICSVS